MSTGQILSTRILSAIPTGASTSLSDCQPITVDTEDRFLAVQVILEGVGGAALSDALVGTIELWCTSAEGIEYSQVTGTRVVEELAKVAMTGTNARISGWAILDGVPGAFAKLLFRRTSGGGGNSRLSLIAST